MADFFTRLAARAIADVSPPQAARVSSAAPTSEVPVSVPLTPDQESGALPVAGVSRPLPSGELGTAHTVPPAPEYFDATPDVPSPGAAPFTSSIPSASARHSPGDHDDEVASIAASADAEPLPRAVPQGIAGHIPHGPLVDRDTGMDDGPAAESPPHVGRSEVPGVAGSFDAGPTAVAPKHAAPLPIAGDAAAGMVGEERDVAVHRAAATSNTASHFTPGADGERSAPSESEPAHPLRTLLRRVIARVRSSGAPGASSAEPGNAGDDAPLPPVLLLPDERPAAGAELERVLPRTIASQPVPDQESAAGVPVRAADASGEFTPGAVTPALPDHAALPERTTQPADEEQRTAPDEPSTPARREARLAGRLREVVRSLVMPRRAGGGLEREGAAEHPIPNGAESAAAGPRAGASQEAANLSRAKPIAPRTQSAAPRTANDDAGGVPPRDMDPAGIETGRDVVAHRASDQRASDQRPADQRAAGLRAVSPPSRESAPPRETPRRSPHERRAARDVFEAVEAARATKGSVPAAAAQVRSLTEEVGEQVRQVRRAGGEVRSARARDAAEQSAALAEDAAARAAAARPTVTITIGRIEVRAEEPAAAPQRRMPTRPSGPTLPLKDYLKRRNQGEQ